MPFVTEEIWRHLPRYDDVSMPEALMVTPWPRAGEIDDEAEAKMEIIMETVRAIRNARAEYEVEPGRRIAAMIAAGPHYDTFADQHDILTRLARIDPEHLVIAATLPTKPEKVVSLVVDNVEVYLPLAGLVDLNAERERLGKDLAQVEIQLTRTQGLLANKDFTGKAPAHVVEREQDKLADLERHAAKLRERLDNLA
jgi:valyl-tRNA synthetase